MNSIQRITSSVCLLLLLAFTAACSSNDFNETFDDEGNWGVGREADVSGDITGGVYELTVESSNGIFWSSAGVDLTDGTYVVEATQIDGPLDNGYGMMFMADMEADNFYLFEVSGDGYVWIGYCEAGCQGNITQLVDSGWFQSSAVRQGLNQTNELRVEVEEGTMLFFVNGQEVGRAFNEERFTGDVGILVETIGAGGVQVHFDNYRYTPVE